MTEPDDGAATPSRVDGGTPGWKRPESVLVVVHATSGEVLLLQRSDDPAFWQSVTGSLEAGETSADAARRELLEETGIEAVPLDRHVRNRFEIRGLWRARYAPGVTRNVEHVFEVRLDAPCPVTLDPDEHLAYRWLTADDALALASSPTNEVAIREAVAPGAVVEASVRESIVPPMTDDDVTGAPAKADGRLEPDRVAGGIEADELRCDTRRLPPS